MAEQPQGNTIADVADRIASLPGGLLAFDEEPGDAPEKAAPETQENSAPEQEPETDEAGADEETDTDKEPEAEEEPETDKPASEDDDPVYEVTLPDGTAEEVSVSKLAEGYARGKELETLKVEAAELRRDYERRVQEIPSIVSQKLQEQENRLAQTIQQWVQANPEVPVPSLELLDENSPNYDPNTYYRLKEQREIRLAKYAEAAVQLQGIAQQREEQHRAYEAQEREKLYAAWPELKDSAEQQTLVRKAGEYFGLTKEDVLSIQNHKAFLVLKDAIGYREMKAKAPEVRQKAKAPKPKPVKPGVRKTDKDIRKADIAEQHKRLRKTGKPEDAMAIFERMSNL